MGLELFDLLQAKNNRVKDVIDCVNQWSRQQCGIQMEFFCSNYNQNEFLEAKVIFNLIVASERNNIGTGLWSQATNQKFV